MHILFPLSSKAECQALGYQEMEQFSWGVQLAQVILSTGVSSSVPLPGRVLRPVGQTDFSVSGGETLSQAPPPL